MLLLQCIVLLVISIGFNLSDIIREKDMENYTLRLHDMRK
jgi:hypothetical protein